MARTRLGRLTPRTLAIGMVAIGAVAIGLGAAGFASAALGYGGPTRTSWSTYLRAGPGETYAVIDELEHDTAVQVLGCGDRWCQVTLGGAKGYIDKDALTLPATPSGKAMSAVPEACFSADQTGYRGSTPTRFCPSAPPSRRSP